MSALSQAMEAPHAASALDPEPSPPKARKCLLTASEKARATEMRKRGDSQRTIAKALGRHRSMIERWLRSEGVLAPPRKSKKAEIVRKLLAEGMGIADISKQTGIPTSTIHYWTRKAILPKPQTDLRFENRGGFVARQWTKEEDDAIREHREQRRTWMQIAALMGMSHNAVYSRGTRIGLPGELPERSPGQKRDYFPLPPGDPISWGAINAGTCLEGVEYPR